MKKYRVIWFLLLMGCLFAAVLSLTVGSANMSADALRGAFWRMPGYETESVILWSLRMPRMLCAVVAGVGLSLSGVLLQNVTGNDLASPNIIGVNAGAGFMVVLVLTLAPALWRLLPLAAFIGALAAALLILALSSWAGQGKGTVILAGVAVSALFQAGISFLAALDSDVLTEYSAFSVGGFRGVGMEKLLLPALLIGICLIVSLLMSGRIQALSLGDDMACGLGVHVKGMRMLAVVLAALNAASVVSFAGLLGFVGLIAPHMARRLTGQETSKQIVTSALVGALLLLLADWAGRVWFAPGEISVGILTALLGAPFFFVLLVKERRHGHAQM